MSEARADGVRLQPRVGGSSTARTLLTGLGIGLVAIALFCIAALVHLSRLNGIVRHLAVDPVPGSAAIASLSRNFNQYRLLEASTPSDPVARDASLARKAGDIDRDLMAYDITITRSDDRDQFAELVASWSSYRDLHVRTVARGPSTTSESAALILGRQEGVAAEIDALLTTMVEWNRLEGVRSTEQADTSTRAAAATVVAMLVVALLLGGLAFYLNRTVAGPIKALAETARSVAIGNLHVRAPVAGPVEVATVARELNEMLDARARAEAHALSLSAAIDESRKRLQRLTDGLLRAGEEERTTTAREIQEAVGQTLAALKMDVAWIGRRLPDDPPALREKLAAMSSLIDETVLTVRRVATDLRPGVLDDLGLEAAVEWQAHDFERRTGIRCALRIATHDQALDPMVATAVFRIVQESLANVARHSRATSVVVTLERLNAELVLEVRDDGVGIEAAASPEVDSIGLASMRERAQSVGGAFSISGADGAGTTVRVQIPQRAEVHA